MIDMYQVVWDVVDGRADRVGRHFGRATLFDKIGIIDRVFDTRRAAFFSLDSSEIPKADVTNTILRNVTKIVDRLDVRLLSLSFHVAVRYGRHSTVCKLLQNRRIREVATIKRDYYVRNNFIGMSPMGVAIRNGDARMIALLLAHNIPFRPYRKDDSRFRFYFDPIEVAKMDLAMDRRVSECDMTYAITSYDMVLIILALDSSRVVGYHHIRISIFNKSYDVTRLLRVHFKEGECLPSLRDISLYTLRISMVREELSMIRSALLDLRTNKKWNDIENHLVLYPLIKKIIESSPSHI